MIDSFQGKYRFLSNFWPASVTLDGTLHFPSVENAYQAAKTTDVARHFYFLNCTPGQAKRAGKALVIRPDWEKVKLGIMKQLLMQKFADDQLKGQLLATGTEDLVEGNHWHDVFWGVCDGVGENHLGKLLMEVREHYRKSGP